MRSLSKNVHKPKTSKSARNSFGATTKREREKGKSRIVESEDDEVEADVLQHPIRRRAFASDVISTSKRKLRGVPDNESPSNRGRNKHATGPSVAPRRSERHKVLGNGAAVPQDDDMSGEESLVMQSYMLD